MVVDEVDTMLTQGFAADIEKLTRPVLCNPERRDTAQFVFVTATLTKEVRKLLDEGNYPKVRFMVALRVALQNAIRKKGTCTPVGAWELLL